tara:strand:- start:3 stop:635 length:633 start_codon:yes stop_codon:yes gene_type:complete
MDKDYWNKIYKGKSVINKPSDFAIFCQNNFFSKDQTLVDIGAGNCRDTLYFLSNKLNVHSIDQSLPKIKNLIINKSIELSIHNCNFYKDDFVNFEYEKIKKIDIYYSRWTLHAINLKDEVKLFENITKNFKKDNLFCIEARTTNDHLYGKGKLVEKNAFFSDHFRRFIDLNEFNKKVLKYGFKVLYLEESNNFSKTIADDPILFRAILSK